MPPKKKIQKKDKQEVKKDIDKEQKKEDAPYEDFHQIIDQELSKRKKNWFLNSVAWIDFDDVCQIIRAHIYKKWSHWDQSRPIKPWLNKIIANQMKNILRNHYSNYARPCLNCPFNNDAQMNLCSFTKSGNQDKLEKTPKPTIAAIDGICMGGGLEVALGCDLRIATPGSKFATPEGRLGIIPGGGATARLPRIVGKGWGMEMMLMGEPIDADRALQIGLVTRLVESDQLLEEVTKMADHLSQFAPFVPRTMKAMVHFGMEASLAGALMFEKYAQGALVQTEDKKEGIEAFWEKRKPSFKGK